MINYYYPPCASSGVFRTLRFVKYLPAFNWLPVVLTIDPQHYGQDESFDQNLWEGNKELHDIHTYRTKVLPGIEQIIALVKGSRKKGNAESSKATLGSVKDHGQPAPSPSIWQRIKDVVTLTGMIPDKKNGWLPYAVMAGWKIMRKESPAVIYASGGPWTAFLIGSLLKKITGTPLVIDFRDPWVDNPYNEYKFSLQEKLNVFLEKSCIRAADYVIANTEPLRTLLVEKYPALRTETCITLTNGYDEAEFQGVSWDTATRSPEDPLIISHVGTLYSKRNPENFLRALSSLIRQGVIPQHKVVIRLIGDVQITGLNEKLACEEIWPCIEFVGYLPKQAALNASLNSDVLLLIQPETALQVPAKLFEYIRLGKPIFAICGQGATDDLITQNALGVVAKDDIADIESKFRMLYEALMAGGRERKTPAFELRPEQITQFDARRLTARLAGLFDHLSNP